MGSGGAACDEVPFSPRFPPLAGGGARLLLLRYLLPADARCCNDSRRHLRPSLLPRLPGHPLGHPGTRAVLKTAEVSAPRVRVCHVQ